MTTTSKLLVLPLCAAMLMVAASADAVRFGGRDVGVKAPGSSSGDGASMAASSGPATGLLGRAEPTTVGATVKVESPAARAIAGADIKDAVAAKVAAAAAIGASRNAQAEAKFDSSANAGNSGTADGLQTVSYQPRLTEARPSKNPELDRERAAEALAVRLFDQSAEKAGDMLAKPVKSAAEITREKKIAADKAVAARVEEEKKMKLAREQSCRIEPVMSDKAIANCLKIFREPS